MTVSITSSVPIRIVYGVGVVYDAPSVPEITTDDISVPNQPLLTITDYLNVVSCIELVGSQEVDATVAGTIPIYAVPMGRTLIPTAIRFALVAISGSGEAPIVSAGFTNGFRDLVDSNRTSTFALAGGSILDPGYGYVPGDLMGVNWGLCSEPAVLAVDSVNSIGGVTAYHVDDAGIYIAIPANPVTTTSTRMALYGADLYGASPYGGGHGTGFTLSATWADATGPFENITNVGQVVSFQDFAATASRYGAGYTYLTGGQVLTVDVEIAATYSTYKLRCLIFGLLTGCMPTAAPGLVTAFGKGSYGIGQYGRISP